MGHGTTAVLFALVLGAAPAEREVAGKMCLPDSSLGRRVQPLLLLSRPDVRADLGLDERQAEAVDRAIVAFVARAAPLRGQKGPGAVEERREIDRDAGRWIEAHLTEAQFVRLFQIDLQWEGPSALVSRPTVAHHLDLKPNQREKVLEAVEARNKKRPQGTFHEDVEIELAKKVLAELSPSQKELWFAMLGRRFVPRPIESKEPAPRKGP